MPDTDTLAKDESIQWRHEDRGAGSAGHVNHIDVRICDSACDIT